MDCSEYKDKDYPLAGRWEIDGYKFNRCPLVCIPPETFFITRLYSTYEKGIPANAGGALDQTNKYIECMTFIQSKLNEYTREQHAAQIKN